MWKRLALTGQPQVFTDYAEYQTLVDNLIATGAIKDPTTSVQKILKYGNGAQRQLEIYQKNQNFQDVANYIVAQTKVMIC
jgi:carboxylate-amine ligase